MKLYIYSTLITTLLLLTFVILISSIPLLEKGFIIGVLSIISGVNIYLIEETKEK